MKVFFTFPTTSYWRVWVEQSWSIHTCRRANNVHADTQKYSSTYLLNTEKEFLLRRERSRRLVRDAGWVPTAPSVQKVYIAICDSPLNPPLSHYGSGLPVKPMSWQGHEIQYSVVCPLSCACLIINNPPFEIVICIILCHRASDTQNAGKSLNNSSVF